MAAVEATDFSGGITDYPLNAPLNKMAACDNLLINQYSTMGKPFTRFGSVLFSQTAPQIPIGAQRISTCFMHQGLVFVQSASKLYFYNSVAWIEVLGPTGNPALIGNTTSEQVNYSPWNAHMLLTTSARTRPQKLIIDNLGEPQIFEAGLPMVAAGTIFPVGGGANQYLYKLVYKQTYTTTGAVVFLDYGPTTTAVAVNVAGSISITAIPVLANGLTSNYRTADIKVEIFRTVNNGNVFYSVAEITNGTTTYTDTMLDATLINRNTLYTTGGVSENDPPPRCLSLHVTSQNVAYYANILTDTGQTLSTRVIQSIQSDVDSVPESYFIDMIEPVVGISSTKSNTVVFCAESVYRLDGTVDELGRGGLTSERISDTAGCISTSSIVQALDGVFWLGPNAVYYTDGYKVVRLNADFSKTYRTWTTTNGATDTLRTRKFQGKYDRVKNRIWWTIQPGAEGDVSMCYILDLTWGVKENATFTTAGGTSFVPTAIEFTSGDMIRCDSRGYVLYHQDELHADKRIDVTMAPTLWPDETIIYYLETAAFNFGASNVRKFVLGAAITCESTTNLSLQIVSNNDDGRVIAPLLPIRYRGNITWGEVDVYWGDTGLSWNLRGLISEKRRMPAKSLRCVYKSLILTNAEVAIVNSEFLGLATVNAAASTVVLSGAFTWPGNSVGYVVYFASDSYTIGYEILIRSDTTLVFADLLSSAVSAVGTSWVLRGKPKGEVLNLLNLSINYEVAGPTLHVYTNSGSGEIGT